MPIQVTLPTLKVLLVMLRGGEWYGLQIAQETGLLSGTLYPVLERIEEAGWATSRFEDIDQSAEGRRARRYYRLTPEGRTMAKRTRSEIAGLISPNLAGMEIHRKDGNLRNNNLANIEVRPARKARSRQVTPIPKKGKR